MPKFLQSLWLLTVELTVNVFYFYQVLYFITMWAYCCNLYTILSGLKQALIGSGAECETRVDQNGKVAKSVYTEPIYKELPEHYSPEDKRMRPLRLRKKIYEFFTAPITKFWADSVSDMLFLLLIKK